MRKEKGGVAIGLWAWSAGGGKGGGDWELQEELRSGLGGRGLPFLWSLNLTPLPCRPCCIKQGCSVKANGLSDTFSFIFHQFILSILVSVRPIAFSFPQINCIILVISDLTQIISWKTAPSFTLWTSFTWLHRSSALICSLFSKNIYASCIVLEKQCLGTPFRVLLASPVWKPSSRIWMPHWQNRQKDVPTTAYGGSVANRFLLQLCSLAALFMDFENAGWLLQSLVGTVPFLVGSVSCHLILG